MALPAIRMPAAAGERGALTVEQYAAFCAELAVLPANTKQIHEKYGVVSLDVRAALHEAFAQRFGADPTLQRRWRALVAHYTDWYRRNNSDDLK